MNRCFATLAALLLFGATGTARAECPDPTGAVDAALAALEILDLEGAKTQIEVASESYGCAPPPGAADLARFFLTDGAILALSGDSAGAIDSFAAAHEIDPAQFLDAFETTIREPYDMAVARTESQSTLTLAPALETGWRTYIDGRPTPLPAEVTAGLHLVQVLPSPFEGEDLGAQAEHAAFGSIVYAPEGLSLGIAHALAPAREPPRPAPVPEPTAAPAPEPVTVSTAVTEAAPASRFTLHLAVGGAAAFGQEQRASVDGQTLEEPSLKAGFPLELGISTELGPLWLRPQASISPLLGGWIYAGPEAVQQARLAWAASVAMGLRAGSTRAGLLAGATLPSRITACALANVQLGSLPLGLEARGGLHLPTQRGPEPMVALLVTTRARTD